MTAPHPEPPAHRYETTISWSGSTGAGYESYARTHQGIAPPAAEELQLSADPAFRGDPALLNPEQLLVLAASSCQMLSFLAIASRARLDVVAYRDDAIGVMGTVPGTHRGTERLFVETIELRPQIELRGAAGVRHERLERLVHLAHEECYIANSVHTAISVQPTFVFV